MSPQVMKIMQVGLPAITLAVTSFMPASVQISFLVSGVLSLFQSTLFRMPGFRSYFKMHPIPAPAENVTALGPYKGTMNVRAPLTQAELNQTYQQGRVTPTAKTTGRENVVKKFVTGTVQGAAKDIKSTFMDAKTSAKELVGKGKDNLSERQAKTDRAAAAAYEERRQKEIQQERYEREQERRARQAARPKKRSR